MIDDVDVMVIPVPVDGQTDRQIGFGDFVMSDHFEVVVVLLCDFLL